MPAGFLVSDPVVGGMVASMIPVEHRRLFAYQMVADQQAWPIFPARDALTAVYGPFEWGYRAGLDPNQVVVLPSGASVEQIPTSWVTSIPLPVSTHDGVGPARWHSRNPQGLAQQIVWPWMWLPPRLAHPGMDVLDGEPVIEPVEVWQARVGLELAAAGLFHPALGWMDVPMALAGVDVDTPEGLARLTRWLDGGSDSQLDELGEVVGQEFLPEDPHDPYWAVDEATVLTCVPAVDGHESGPLMVVAGGVGATGLLDILDDPNVDVDGLRTVVEVGGLLPGQPARSADMWARVAGDMGDMDAPSDVFEARMRCEPARVMLEAMVEAMGVASGFLASRFTVDGVV